MNALRTHMPALSPVEASTVKASVLCVGERRLEAENYLAEGYLLRQRIEEVAGGRLEEFARVWQPGRLKGIQVSASKGTPFLAATQVFDTRPTPRKWLSVPKTPDIEARYVKPGWTLVTCSGSVGDAIMAYRALDGMIISHDLLRVIALYDQDRGFIHAYLRTNYARRMMRSTQYGNVIKHLEPEHLRPIPVPAVSDDSKALLDASIDQSVALRNEAHNLLLAAEALFSSAVGRMEEVVAEVGFQISASSLSGGARRLDAYSHSPDAAAVVGALVRTGRPIVMLSDITERIFLPNRFARGVPLKRGVPLVGTEDLFTVNPELDKFLPESLAPQQLRVQRGWLLVARSGQIYGINGRVVLADRWHEGKVITDDAIRVVPQGVRPGYLLVALGHPVLGRPLVLREVYGTSIPHIDPEALGRVPILRLGSLEDAIADKAEQSAFLLSLADEIENTAVAVLELIVAGLLGEQAETIIDAAVARLRIAEAEAAPDKVLKRNAALSRFQS